MAAPILQKVWQFNVNQRLPPQALAPDQSKALYIALKNSLIGFTSSPWTVWGSCDGAGGAGSFGNNDGVDRWANSTDIVLAAEGSNHSWIVLKQTGLGANTSICINCISNYTVDIYLSPVSGFQSNGSATNRPTATDEILIQNAAGEDFSPSSANYQLRLHVMQSTDGECTRAFMSYRVTSSRLNFWMLLIDKAKNPSADWTAPIYGVFFANAGNNQPDIQALSTWTMGSASVSLAKVATKINGLEVPLWLTSEGTYAAPLAYNQIVGANETTGKYSCYGVGLAAPFLNRGKKGEMYDFWFMYSNSMCLCGDQYEQRKFAQFCQVLVPWDGTQLMLG